jgi:hypothetical protein
LRSLGYALRANPTYSLVEQDAEKSSGKKKEPGKKDKVW